MSTPIHSTTREARRALNGTFFGLSGSMAGGMTSVRVSGKSGGTNPPRVNTAAS